MLLARRREATRILRQTLLELEARGPDELITLEERPEWQTVVGASGREYHASITAFWDADPWESWLYVQVTVAPTGRCIRTWRVGSGLTVDPMARDISRNYGFPV